MIRGYVLIETEVGATQSVGDAVRHVRSAFGKIVAVDTVTGPYDVIVQIEAEDLDRLGKAITSEVATVPGVQRTTTCLSVNLA
ncbi:MAG: Lrp/AsnC ligand binding domain-containing protein [Dehalococcoidia bacterium]